MKNKKLVVLVGLALSAIGIFGCSGSSKASSHGTYAYIPSDVTDKSYEYVKVKNYTITSNGVKIETTDGRTIRGFNITVVEE